VALARALITDPKIVLFDEPTSGLDPVRKNAILSMIAQYRKKFGFTAILVSHEIPIFFISNRFSLYNRDVFRDSRVEEFGTFGRSVQQRAEAHRASFPAAVQVLYLHQAGRG
jgi:phospholipid/cholesterol/gamma-HCH transport system ATP-binding protein